jgi:hypothetical protein
MIGMQPPEGDQLSPPLVPIQEDYCMASEYSAVTFAEATLVDLKI